MWKKNISIKERFMRKEKPLKIKLDNSDLWENKTRYKLIDLSKVWLWRTDEYTQKVDEQFTK